MAPAREDVAVMNELGLDLDTLEQAARLWEDALRAGRETTLQAGARDGRMGTTRNSLKEDRDHGRTREETRGAFLRRAAEAQVMQSMKGKPLEPTDTDGLIGNLPEKMPDRFKRK